jgi:transposase
MGSTRQEWAERVGQWRRSGQTARDFARTHGFNHNTLTHWSWRLGRSAAGASKRRKSGQRRALAGPASLVEVLREGIADGCFELELADGRRLRIPPRFDAESLGRLLGVLEAAQ